jgi:hypothetical protein
VKQLQHPHRPSATHETRNCNVQHLNTRLQHTCIAITTWEHPRSNFTTLQHLREELATFLQNISNTLNISLQQTLSHRHRPELLRWQAWRKQWGEAASLESRPGRGERRPAAVDPAPIVAAAEGEAGDGARGCPRLRPSPQRVAAGLLSGGRGSRTRRRHRRRRGRGWDVGPPSPAPVGATAGGRWPALQRPWIPLPVTTATGGEHGDGAGPPLLAPVATGGRWPAPPEDRWPRASSEKTILKRPWWRRRPPRCSQAASQSSRGRGACGRSGTRQTVTEKWMQRSCGGEKDKVDGGTRRLILLRVARSPVRSGTRVRTPVPEHYRRLK